MSKRKKPSFYRIEKPRQEAKRVVALLRGQLPEMRFSFTRYNEYNYTYHNIREGAAVLRIGNGDVVRARRRRGAHNVFLMVRCGDAELTRWLDWTNPKVGVSFAGVRFHIEIEGI